tara:strand:+ start:263 stop:427 length:165 start_codon:yes stop_codon:yes gene_type:complete
MESSFRIVGQYKTKEIAEEKRTAFRVIEDKGNVFFYICETPLRLTEEVENVDKE